MSSIKKFCICAVCVALCYVLPVVLHPFGLGTLISPLHIPVLVCGLVCGSVYGGICGVVGPILCSMLTGMPAMPKMPIMLPELAVYGICAGFFMKKIRVKRLLLKICMALVPTISLGRIAAALAIGGYYVIGVFGVTSFSMSDTLTLYFVNAVPTIVIQMVFVPMLVVTLKEEKMISV